ncbi:cryptochrome/photolyase family protein [Streptomyces albidus (ex Kaewkla and Franco 2022)]|uniref:cryptochrome/photolyase family protein n=1 Tax=Streptomyces albidus (ex Kaewkla and Franco 2022) TaxID=722709 RepID=UPI0015EF7474|nr:deoxyribodipyrimidine photo-lyase [Streptomyces albidus (ex Kaewkla and Franco 2022)]
MTVSVALFTADLRLHDNPVLRAALDSADEVVPLFVLDSGVRAAGFDAPNRRAFLADCLADLDAELRERGGRLVVRSGDVTEETRALASECDAQQVHVAGDVSGYAQRREDSLRRGLAEDGRELRVHDAVVTALPPGAVTPQGRDHFAVFTPYWRRWAAEALRPVLGAPRVVRVPEGVSSAALPDRSKVAGVSPGLAAGGESEGRARFSAWRGRPMKAYAEQHDDLYGDATSRLSPHLHFGTLSPVELVHKARQTEGEGPDAFVRQLAWRDFHHQVLAARPRASWEDYRTHDDRWRSDEKEIAAWQEGRTGYPLVDAAMRQLRHEGWMHNRARLLAASFLTKTLYVDWRVGARHFLDLLVDGDVANNQLNWQWVAGTGTDTRPNRVLNPLSQAKRFDPDGAYVRRWVPELEAVEGASVHQPWKLPAAERASLDYPDPLIDLSDGLDRFRRARGVDGG